MRELKKEWTGDEIEADIIEFFEENVLLDGDGKRVYSGSLSTLISDLKTYGDLGKGVESDLEGAINTMVIKEKMFVNKSEIILFSP